MTRGCGTCAPIPRLKKGISVENMIDRLHESKAIDDLEVGTLHRLRKSGNRGSHEDDP